MAFIAAEPPSIRPRGNTTSRPSRAGCGVVESPVDLRAIELCSAAGIRTCSLRERPGLDQQHRDVRVLREARGENAAGRPISTLDVVHAEDRSSRSRYRSRVPHVTRWCLASVHGDGDEKRSEGHDGNAVGAAALVEEARFRSACSATSAAVVVQPKRRRRTAHPVRLHDRRVRETGPVTMRARDLERLRAALERAPVLREALGL